MIGYRGALRYMREPDLLGLELEAIDRVWDAGPHELPRDAPLRPHPARGGRAAASRSQAAGPARRGRGFELWVMAEVPSVLFHLARYAELGVAGISIGSNDLTQLLLGADRDSELVAEVFDERDPAVTEYIAPAAHPRPRARPADLDLRPGALGPPRVRGAARPRRDRRDLGQHRRRRPRPPPDRRGRAAAAARNRPQRELNSRSGAPYVVIDGIKRTGI